MFFSRSPTGNIPPFGSSTAQQKHPPPVAGGEEGGALDLTERSVASQFSDMAIASSSSRTDDATSFDVAVDAMVRGWNDTSISSSTGGHSLFSAHPNQAAGTTPHARLHNQCTTLKYSPTNKDDPDSYISGISEMSTTSFMSGRGGDVFPAPIPVNGRGPVSMGSFGTI